MSQHIVVPDGGSMSGKTTLAKVLRETFNAHIIYALEDPIPDGTELVVYDGVLDEATWKNIQETWKNPIVVWIRRMDLNPTSEWVDASRPTWQFRDKKPFVAKPMSAFFLNHESELEVFVVAVRTWFTEFIANDYVHSSRHPDELILDTH